MNKSNLRCPESDLLRALFTSLPSPENGDSCCLPCEALSYFALLLCLLCLLARRAGYGSQMSSDNHHKRERKAAKVRCILR